MQVNEESSTGRLLSQETRVAEGVSQTRPKLSDACPGTRKPKRDATREEEEGNPQMEQQVDARIIEEAHRIATQPGVQAVLLAGSYARGHASPLSDVDLFVITKDGPKHSDIADVDWTTFDTGYTTIEDLEQDITTSFIACNALLDVVTLFGDASWEQRIETLARQTYPRYVPRAEALEELHQQLRTVAQRAAEARARDHQVFQAHAGGNMVWLAGKICLSLLGIGPVREDQWHDRLNASSLPFDAATPFVRWYLGQGLDERLEAAFTLAERVLGESLARESLESSTHVSPPAFEMRPHPDALEAVEMARLVQAVGFGKMAKALWLQDEVRQAAEAGTITWFSVPACLALGGLVAPKPHWWHEALCQIILSFDAAMLYKSTLLGTSFEERKEAASILGRETIEALKPIFRHSPYEHKYRRD